MTVGAVGGVVGYSSVDPDFRKLVEENVPGADQVLDLVIGEKAPAAPAKSLPPPPSKLKISSPVVITKPKEEKLPAVIAKEEKAAVDVKKDEQPPVEKKEELKPVKVEEPAPSKKEEPVVEVPTPSPAAMSVPPPPLEEPPVKTEVPEEKPAPTIVEEKIEKKEETEPAVETPESKPEEQPVVTEEEVVVKEEAPTEPTHDIENSSLELMLGELCQEMQDIVNVTIDDLDVASRAVLNHMELMEKVLESNVSAKDEAAWNHMFVAAQTKSEKNKLAENSERKAKVAIANVVESVAAGRKNKITSTNPKLLAAEEAANKALYILDQAKVKRASVETEAKIMEEYRDLVEVGREEFQKEMASIMPDVKLGEKSGKLTEEELNMFITHAYRKVMFLQQELAKVQTLEQEKFRKALEKQRMETTSLAVDQLDSELEKQARELHVEHERKLAAIRDEAEAELRVQMKRQAAAHADHISDVLSVQEAEISRKLNHEKQETVDSLSSQYTASLAKLAGVVGGLKGGLEARAGADEALLTSQSLWVASSKLNVIVNSGNAKAKTWDGKLAPIGGAVKAIEKIAGDEDKFVSTICSSIPKLALDRGVYTEDSLKERFSKVEKNARKVAAVGEEGGSLLSYGLSYLQSLLLMDLSERKPVQTMEVVDLASISSYDLLSLAKHNLDRGDLARAVQLLTQLRGEAGRVVSDWLGEARLTLETKQAVSAIMAHSLVTSGNNMITK